MAEEELKVNQEEDDIKVGGEEELKVKQTEDELKVKQKTEPEKDPEDEKKEATVQNEPEETSLQKPYTSDFEPIKEQDISQYLWDTFLKYLNKGLGAIHDRTINAVDSGLSERERGPSVPETPKEKKVEHTNARGKRLYDLRDAVTDEFAKSVTQEYLSSATNIKNREDREKLKNIMVHAHKIAYDLSVSDFLHEKMSKDKDFKFAEADTKSIVKDIQQRTLEKQDKLMAGVLATSFYSENIEGMSAREALNSCEEYLNIRENESNEIKKQVLQDLEQGNFLANEKKPSRDTSVRLNAYNRSFENDALIIHSSLKEAIHLIENTNLSTEERMSLQEFQKKANLFQTFEAGLDLKRQIKTLDEAYKTNKNYPVRSRIAAMKKTLGVNPISVKMSQKYAGNAILLATSRGTGRK